MIPLEERLGYKFRNSLLLAEALTHPSLRHETRAHPFDNQRLEFLGDAVLQLIFSEYVYSTNPESDEGALTKLRARLVSRIGLAQLASTLDLGVFILMAKGEESTGGRGRESMLADTMESLVGAVYLDSDFPTARKVVLRLAMPLLEKLDVGCDQSNPKGDLQEILQSLRRESPIYEIVAESGPEHSRTFIAQVVWAGRQLGRGEGRSKRAAETAAAADALVQKAWLGTTPE